MTRNSFRVNRSSALSLIALLVLVVGTSAVAQQEAPMVVDPVVKPKYTVLPPSLLEPSQLEAVRGAATAKLTTYNGSFVSGGKTFTYNMVGNAPSSNSSVTIPVFIVPIKVVVRGSTFDPAHILSDGKNVVQNTLASPLFTSTTTFVQGGVNVGTTQYIDAYSRASFWGIVKSHTNYHLLLGAPTVLAEQTLNVPSRSGTTGTPFGSTVGLVDINFFDAQVQAMIRKFTQIVPNSLPIFLINDVYLTQGGSCCIGGYHSVEGSTTNPQAYSIASYVDHPGEFAQDVSALSHEIGEWSADPLVANPNGNNTPCGILENGDPIEGNANFGGFPYTSGGFTYNLQDLVTIEYFGAPANTSVNNFFSFQGEALTVCQNGS
jgi:hypothetical protein